MDVTDVISFGQFGQGAKGVKLASLWATFISLFVDS